jgi:6-phosphogluconate dehydrogenase (decarboxylating)
MFQRTFSVSVKRMLIGNQCLMSTTNTSKIGFIGLGNMGLSMAKNILKNEKTGQKHGVVVYDINAESVKSMEELGAKVRTSGIGLFFNLYLPQH